MFWKKRCDQCISAHSTPTCGMAIITVAIPWRSHCLILLLLLLLRFFGVTKSHILYLGSSYSGCGSGRLGSKKLADVQLTDANQLCAVQCSHRPICRWQNRTDKIRLRTSPGQKNLPAICHPTSELSGRHVGPIRFCRRQISQREHRIRRKPDTITFDC